VNRLVAWNRVERLLNDTKLRSIMQAMYGCLFA
jgi:hypothetical protein